MKKFIAIALSIGILGGVSGCGFIQKTPQGIANTVVAKINDQNITKGEFDKKFASYLEQLKMYYGEEGMKELTDSPDALKAERVKFLDSLVSEAVLVQKAKAANLMDDKALNDEVEKKYKETVDQYKGEQELKKKLEEAKTTIEELKKSIKNDVLVGKLQENTVKDVTVTDQEIQNYYSTNKYSYTEKPSKMNISHILVETEAKAKELKNRAEKGEKFEDLAKANSLDTGTKDKGGSLGDVDYANNQLDQKFFLTAVDLPVGKISDPVNTVYGWHIIKMNSKTAYPVKPLESVKEEIKSTLLSQNKNKKYSEELAKWKEAAKIKTYPDRL